MAQFGEDGGDDQGFDVGSALDDLINTSTGAPAGTPVNPDMLVNRLARKVGASVKPRAASPQPGAAVAPGSPPAAPPAADDLSSFGLNPDDLAGEADQPPRPQGVDLSSFGAPADSMAPEAAAKKPEKGPGVLGSIGRGLARGAPEGLGEAMQGAAIFHPGAQAPDALTGLIGELRNVPNMTQAERAALMARAVRAGKEPSIGAISTPFNAALQRIAAGADPEQEISALTEGYSNRAKKGLQNPSARELYDAGKSVKDWAEKTFPATDKEKESIPYQVAHGVSAMGPYVAAGIINPIFGLGLGAAGMGLQVGASTFEDAKNKGATDEQATQAAGWGAAVGGALGVLPLGMVLKPVSQSSPGMKAWLTAKLVQAGQSGATFATVGEAQEYLLKQVAKEFYDKEAGYSPDAHRTIVSLLTGAVLGPLHPLRKDAKNTPSSGGADEPPSISGPFSPGGGPDFRRSSPEDISEFIRKAKESAPKDGAGEEKKSSYTGPDPATMSDAELMAAFDAARASHDGARMEDILRSSGLSDERIAAMSEMDKIYATIRATKEGYAGKEGPDGSTAEPGRSKTEDVEREALKRRGLTDEQIDAMAPADRRKAFQDAMSGVEEPKQAGAAKDDNPNGLRAMGSGLANAMTEGLVDRYWSRAKAGYDHDLGQKDALLQAAKIVREAGGLQTRDEFKAFMQDYGRIDSGDGFQSSMRAIVSKYMPKPSGDGSRNNPIVPRTADDVAKITDAVTEPKSPQQAEAENYKHGHVEMEHLGLSGKNGISVETGKGQRRSGVDEDGNDWHVENMPVPYGRIKGTKSSDGQPLDIFIGPNPLSKNIFVIQQNRPRGGGFDEHKILAGFDTQQDALSAYKLSYNDGGGDRIGPIVTMDRDKFWSWVESGGALHPFDSDRSSIGDKPETTSDHHAQIDAVLGEDSSRVLPADAARAAEILAENPGMDPGTAFENAVVEGAVEQKFLTHQEAVEAYGKDVESILEPEREGAPVGGGDVEQKGAAPVEVGSGGAKETGVVPGGGEDRARSGTEGQGDQKSGDTAAKDAKSGADETGPRSAVDATSGDQNAENKPAAENTDAAGVSGDERGKPVIYTGSVWKTKSGRETTPAPKIDAATDRKTKRSLFLLDQWLLENARAEVNGNDYQETLLKKLDPKKFSQSDRDTVNLLLFGDENGPRQSDEVKNQETKFFKHESDNTLGLGIDNPTRDQMIVALEEENKKFSNVDGTPKHPNEKINAYILGLNKEIIRQLRDGEQYDKDKSIREGNKAQKAFERSKLASDKNKSAFEDASKAMEDKINAIEIAVEAKDKKAAFEAAADARKFLASVSDAVKKEDPEYWDQFTDVIHRMMKPGYITAMQAEKAKEKLERQQKEDAGESEQKNKIDDAGEKIGGARKDKWIGRGLNEDDLAGMTGAELDRHVTKQNVWPRPDYARAVADEGVEPLAAAHIKLLYDRLASKPNEKYSRSPEEARKKYIATLNKVRESLSDVKTSDDVIKALRELSNSVGWDNQYSVMPSGGRRTVVHVHYNDAHKAKKLVDNGFPNIEPWQRIFQVYERDTGKYVNDKRADGTPFTRWEKTGVEYVASRKNGAVIAKFGTRDEAVAAAKKAYEDIGKGKSEGGEEPKRPHLDRIERTGPDHRKGKDATSQDFIDTFGFKGVEFGNWVAGDERQKVVNLGFDALMDLAAAVGVPPKALSLNGTLSIAFGARGRGGRASAHYEPDRVVVNMTKLTGAGSLAHEYGHAIDHYLGEIDTPNPYGGSVKMFSGGRFHPESSGVFADSGFTMANGHLRLRLRVAVNRLMDVIYRTQESDEQAIDRLEKKIQSYKSGLASWKKEADRIRARISTGGSRSGLTKAEQQIEVWSRGLKSYESQLENGVKSTRPSEYLTNAQSISGPSGDYWHRPTELVARSFESYVFDKISQDGRTSQYLVQGVEPNRYSSGFKGNPYPAGDERTLINGAWDRVFRAIELGEGKHGAGTRIQPGAGEPEQVTVEPVKKTGGAADASDETAAIDEAMSRASLSDTFAKHLADGGTFKGILHARKLAKETGHDTDPKAVEEAMEAAVVKVARGIVSGDEAPAEKFANLVDLYGRQPKLSTRTSTSVRDQAYSTPVPLAYLASRLAGIDRNSSVYEPAAGNGALLIEANPKNVVANEINPDRRKSLEDSGFNTTSNDGANPTQARAIAGADPVDVVIANPPFGAVNEGGKSKSFDLTWVRPGYETTEIDHAMAFAALKAMRDDGRAVLLIGGVSKMKASPEARSNAYHSQSKRLFYKALYDDYNVVDHFTVDGDLYARQGARWPVDVVVIDGRSPSKRRLPAVDVPNVFSTWEELGGLLDGNADGRSPAGEAVGASDGGRGGLDRSGQPNRRMDERRGAVGVEPEPREPGGMGEKPRGDRGPELAGNDGEGGRGEHPVGGDGNRSGEQAPSERRPSGLDDFDALFDAALDSVYGKDQPSEPAPAGTSGTRSTAGGGGARVQRKRSGGGAERDARTDAEVSKDTAKAAAESADAAFEGLYKLFGGDKLSSGFTFDEQTWAKAKPMFTKAAEKFAEFRKNMGELLRRMVDHMSKTLGWPREVQNRMRPYFKRFAEELTSGEIRLGEEDAPKAGEPKAEAKKPAEGGGADGVHQIEYRPRSKSNGLDTLAPKNMRDAMEQSLARLERDVGSIDAFVAKELGYDNDAAGNMFDAFGAEQIDAIALAINALKKNKGFIIGDQTGIGKGRVNAAIIRWAIKNGHTPIFVTHKPNLYQDMYRDMTAIGMNDGSFLDGPVRILATNSGPDIELGGGHSIKTGNTKSHGELLSSFIDGSKKLEDSFDVVFTTYDQLNAVDKKDTIRRNFIWSIAPKSILILDESHNAGGTQSERGKKQGDADSRAEYTRKIIDRARGAFYSSATYAKRPDVMDLYSKTNISLAVSDKKLLAQTIESGGIPLQQVVAAMLAKDGQYVRRERSFNGITYDTPIISVDRSSYDAMSYSLADINAFSMFVKSVAEKISEDIKGAGDALGYDNATGGAGASSTNFTSIMHNVIKQMLLAIKADAAADMAIEHIKQGRKPVITVSGTMESFLSDYSANLGIETGGKISSDFAIVLQKYLDRTRTILIKKPFETDKKKKVERRYLTDDELGPIGVGLYNSARVGIETLKIGHLPISPIDYIIGKIEGAGYSVGEITGRTLRVDYSGESPILSTRPGKDKTPGGRNATLKRFNTRHENGGSHAIILNQAGSTGLSAHASKEFDDRSPRTMLIVQPEDNIDTHMQLLGRINRTGQVVLPSFYQLTADIPAEKRPSANLAKKMASLNANTTASRTSAVTSKDAPDFMNKYGDIVAFNWATDNPDINRRLGNPIDLSGGEKKIDGAMRSITGRLPLLPLAKQENAYSELESGYKELLSQVEAAGENALEAKLLDLKAKPIEQTEVVAGDLSNSSQFTKSVNIVKANVARLGKPYSPKEVAQLIADNVGMKVPEGADVTEFIRKADVDHNSDIGRALIKQHENTRDEVFNAQKAYVRSVVDEIETDTKRHSENVRLAENLSRWTDAYDLVRPGSRVVLKGAQGNITGFVIGVSKKGDTKNPIALGSWKAVIAVADSSRRIEIPFRNIFKEGRSDESSSTDIEIQRTQPWYEDHAKTVGNFESMQREVREDRYIAVGNMLAAFAWTGNKGSIINFTDANGKIHQGILMARNFDLAKKMKDAGVLLKSASEVKSRIDSDGSIVSSGEGNLEISKDGRYSDSYSIYVDKSKRTGGKYYLDKGLTDITGDFISRSGKMHSQVYDDKIVPAINRMMQIGAKFVVESKAGAPKPRPMDEFLESRKTASTPAEYIPLEKQAEIETLVTGFMRGMIGNAAKIEYSQGLMSMSGDSSSRWGNVPNQGARGLYLPYRHIVRLALTADIASSAFHETYHVVEYQLQTPRERSLMERETPRLRNIVAREKGYSRDQAASISPEEIRAVAFEEYGMARFEGRSVKGLHVGVRGWFEKLFVNLRRLANGLRGLGFETYEDIFGKVYDGGYANAEGKTPRPEAAGDGALAAIHPGRPQPRNVAETIAEKLEKHNLSRLAELSHAVRIGDINLTELREQLQDKFIRIKHAEQSVGKIPSSQSAYHAEELYYGRAGERLEGLEKRHVDPLIHDMKQFDISLEELGAFLYARHAPERNAEVDKINPSLGGEGSGMSDADAARIVDGVMRGPRRNAFLAVEKRVRAIIDDTLSTAVNYGLVSAESAKEWRDRYRNYVPLRGFAEGFDIFGAGDSQSGFDTRKPHSKQALGRKSLADNPLMYVLHQAQSTIINGEKNRLGNGWLAFVQNHPDADRWSVNTPDLKRTINKTTGLVEYRIDNNWYFRKDAFVTRVGGRPQVIRMHGKEGERLASALRNMGTSELNSVLKFMRVLTTTMARLSTAWNPNFIIPNWTRDLGEAFINLNEGQKKDIVKRFSKHIFPSITGSFQALSGQHGGKYAQAFRDFDRAGGRIHFFGLDNIEDINASLAKKLRKLDKGPVANIENAVGNVIDGIEIVSGAIENANRLAAFMAARDVGMSDADAARLARNLTVNFNKHGNLGPVIGALYMFANASIQGTARMARAVRHKGVRRAIYGLMALSALSALYNMAAGGDDEAGENYYARIKPYIRNKNFILMYPKGMGRDGDYVKVPLPYGFSPFAVLGSNLAMFANGKMSAAKATSAVLSSLADAFNPLGEESVAEYLLIPSIFRAGAHINSNKNWTGNPIYPENDYNKHLPDSQKFFKSNSEFSKWVAGGLNSATGGSPYKSGWIDWHPGSVDHVLETVTGGLGKFVVDVVKMGTAAGSGEFDAAKAPVVRRFYGHASDRDADQQTYYERRDEARKSGEKSLKAASNDVHRGINTEIAKGFIEENRRTSVLESIFKSADSVMKPLRAREAQITADESLSAEYKRTEIERIREQMRAIQNRARKQYADKKRELEGKNVQ